MPKDIDHTKNTSGPKNMVPPLPYRPGANEAIIDGLIRDKWIDPDMRWQEVCALYQGQAAAESRLQRWRAEARDRAEYAKGWVERFLQDSLLLSNPDAV